jgi:hypothetical protein
MRSRQRLTFWHEQVGNSLSYASHPERLATRYLMHHIQREILVQDVRPGKYQVWTLNLRNWSMTSMHLICGLVSNVHGSFLFCINQNLNLYMWIKYINYSCFSTSSLQKAKVVFRDPKVRLRILRILMKTHSQRGWHMYYFSIRLLVATSRKES